MGKFKVWQVGQGIPLKLVESNVGLEKNLEGWIEADPSLLPGELEIICRQMSVEGGRLDLLALDPLGRCVIIEVKAGALFSDVIAQALYYAAQIDRYSFETLETKVHYYLNANNKDLKTMLQTRGLDPADFQKNKEMLIFLVGTQSASGIETMLDFMGGKYHMPLTAVTFEVFQLENGQRILVREISEADMPIAAAHKKPAKSAPSIEKACALADQTGVGPEFRLILEESRRLGLHQRPYALSIMYTHPDHKTRMLFTVWAHQKPLKAYVGYEAFVDYYPVTTEQVAEALGPEGWRRLDLEEARQLVSGLERIISFSTPGE
jgi:Holliday junction resolvase-like predicted endonuclease